MDTTSGSEHTNRQNRTEVKPDGAREIRWGEGAGVALCGCGRPLSGDGGGQGVRDLNSEPGQGRSHKERKNQRCLRVEGTGTHQYSSSEIQPAEQNREST